MGFCNSSRITELVSEIDAVLLKHKTSFRTKSGKVLGLFLYFDCNIHADDVQI